MCRWGGKKDLGLSVAASAAKVWQGRSLFSRRKKSQSIEIKSVCWPWHLNSSIYIPMLRGERRSLRCLFIHKEMRRLYFSCLIEQKHCTGEESVSYHGVQRARHCLSLRAEHKNTERDNIHNIDGAGKRHRAWYACITTSTRSQWRRCASWGRLSCCAGWQALLSRWSFCFTSNKTPQLCIRLH